MPSNFTEHYSLSQWERTDKVQMEDFNADNAKIDEALRAEADARAALQTALAKKGNCSISLSTYTGTGTHGSNNPTRITFPRRPTAFIIAGYGAAIGQGGGSSATSIFYYDGRSGVSTVSTSWSGSTVLITDNFTANAQLNTSGQLYAVIGLYAES